VLRDFALKALALLCAAGPLLSCDEGLRLVVVEQGGNSGSSVVDQAGTGATVVSGSGGSAVVIPAGGTQGESGGSGGSLEPATSGAAGSPDESAAGAGGAMTPPDVAVWDAPPRYTASFVSHTFPGQYLRYVEDKGFIAAIDMASAADREQASFEMIPGLYDAKCSSFRALNKPATLFRHSGSRIYMNPASTEPLFWADATFCEEAGMADATGVTFRSVNYPQRAIHLRNENELWIDDIPNPMTPEFASDATFYRETALSERPTP
jgi:Alpha-L-arabinofuranosidase B (ABFB) domain